MKKHLLFIATATLAMSMLTVSCLDTTEGSMYYQACLTKIDVEGESYTFVTDDSIRIIPLNMESTIEALSVNSRLIGEFNIPSGVVSDPMEVEFSNLYKIPSDTILLTNQADTLASNTIAINSIWLSGGLYGAARFLNIHFFLKASNSNISHNMYLADDLTATNPDSEGYYHLTIKHDANEDPEHYLTAATYSFQLLDQHTAEGIKGFKITFDDFSLSEKEQIGTNTLSSPITVYF